MDDTPSPTFLEVEKNGEQASDASDPRPASAPGPVGPQGAHLKSDAQHLRVLIANERRDRLELLAQVVIGLGHDVIAREIYVKEVGPATAQRAPRRRPRRARPLLRARARPDRARSSARRPAR